MINDSSAKEIIIPAFLILISLIAKSIVDSNQFMIHYSCNHIEPIIVCDVNLNHAYEKTIFNRR